MKYPEPHDPFDAFNDEFIDMDDDEFERRMLASGVSEDFRLRGDGAMDRLRREFPTKADNE